MEESSTMGKVRNADALSELCLLLHGLAMAGSAMENHTQQGDKSSPVSAHRPASELYPASER